MLAATLPSGLLGLVVAGMLAASISTYAGYFLGWSSIIAQDVVAPMLSRGTPVGPVPREASDLRGLSGRSRLLLTRFTVVALTVFIMIWSLVYDLPGPAYFYLQVTANLFMAPTLIAVVGGLYWARSSAFGATLAFLLGAGTSLAYLVPALRLDVATAGNLSWALAVAGFVAGSLLVPPAPGGLAGEEVPS
jgi:SSS family solute:Na+ symporter